MGSAGKSTAELTTQIVERHPVDSGGASDNTLELVKLRDGRELILKRVSPEWDWLSRATGDRGRIVSMWRDGLLDRMPEIVDHATVGVEAENGTWSIFMRDVSQDLVADGRKLSRGDVGQVLDAVGQLHRTFWGEDHPDLCALEDRYRLLSFETARREEKQNSRVAGMITRSWDAVLEAIPKELGETTVRIVEEPRLLADELRKCTQTLIHGDLRLTNLGFSNGRVVLIDWGERTGFAPAAVEIASFLIFDALQLEVSREEVIDGFRERCGDRFEERALQLALIGGFVQLGANFGLRMISDDPARREAAKPDLDWWIGTVDRALETWSPG